MNLEVYKNRTILVYHWYTQIGQHRTTIVGGEVYQSALALLFERDSCASSAGREAEGIRDEKERRCQMEQMLEKENRCEMLEKELPERQLQPRTADKTVDQVVCIDLAIIHSV